MGYEVTALGDGPFDARLAGLLVGGATAQLRGKLLGDIRAEHPA